MHGRRKASTRPNQDLGFRVCLRLELGLSCIDVLTFVARKPRQNIELCLLNVISPKGTREGYHDYIYICIEYIMGTAHTHEQLGSKYREP